MLLFWLLASFMILAALALVVPPLMRHRATGRDAPVDANVALYRERLAELDGERDRGEVEADRYATLREDLERGLLADVGALEVQRTGASPPPYWMAIAVAVMVPVCGLGFYLWLGSPHGLDSQSSIAETTAGTEQAPSVEAMVASLAARLADNPADAEGWLLLGRSQVVLERFDAAIVAFERAHALLGDDPTLLADWAEAEAAIAGNRFPTTALGRLERALELDPGHEKALWLGGFAAAQAGRPDVAVARWERLLARQTPGVARSDHRHRAARSGSRHRGDDIRHRGRGVRAFCVDPAGDRNQGGGRSAARGRGQPCTGPRGRARRQ